VPQIIKISQCFTELFKKVARFYGPRYGTSRVILFLNTLRASGKKNKLKHLIAVFKH